MTVGCDLFIVKFDMVIRHMLLNPTDRYLLKKGKLEGKLEGKSEVACKLLADGFPIEKVIELTGLTENDILNLKH